MIYTAQNTNKLLDFMRTNCKHLNKSFTALSKEYIFCTEELAQKLIIEFIANCIFVAFILAKLIVVPSNNIIGSIQ